MSEDVLHRLDLLIAVSERIADGVDNLEMALRDIDSNVSTMQSDIGRLDEYAHSITLDVNSILVAMP